MPHKSPSPPCHSHLTQLVLIVFLLILFLAKTQQAEAIEAITIAVDQRTLDQYKTLIANFDNNPCNISNIPKGKSSRTAVEIVILAKAFRLGGLDAPLQFQIVPNPRRGTENTIIGTAIMYSQQLNKRVLMIPGYKQNLFMSDPITRTGEFQKGFYCLDTNSKVLAATTTKELNDSGPGIIGLHWDNDLMVLNEMGISNIISAPTFPSIIKMIIAGRATWIPLEISNSEDMAKTIEGHRFVPVPGIKFSLIESRHFFVSRKHPEGKQVFDALQKGLKELRKQGFIRKALIATGFFSPETKSWKILNTQAMEKAIEKLTITH